MRSNKPTVAEIIACFNAGFIGKIEARNWLANEFGNFKSARRRDVDDLIEKLGSENEPESDQDESDLGG